MKGFDLSTGFKKKELEAFVCFEKEIGPQETAKIVGLSLPTAYRYAKKWHLLKIKYMIELILLAEDLDFISLPDLKLLRKRFLINLEKGIKTPKLEKDNFKK